MFVNRNLMYHAYLQGWQGIVASGMFEISCVGHLWRTPLSSSGVDDDVVYLDSFVLFL